MDEAKMREAFDAWDKENNWRYDSKEAGLQIWATEQSQQRIAELEAEIESSRIGLHHLKRNNDELRSQPAAANEKLAAQQAHILRLIKLFHMARNNRPEDWAEISRGIEDYNYFETKNPMEELAAIRAAEYRRGYESARTINQLDVNSAREEGKQAEPCWHLGAGVVPA